ncbi:MAG: YdcF family protein [Gammaproteobacteria bacterium]|nr:YdcF family protein [Gammaproteobacteria bacterium]MBU1723263.1 YdcF family protein [Gammaproteobacteria bacterium]MBU2003856.1 YdcF family protein [Gammaproteobacteria bacterium]
MFLFKKLFSSMVMPLSLTLLLFLFGLLLLWFTRRQKTGKVLVTAGMLLLLAQVYGWGFEPALKSLEREIPPVVTVPADAGYRWVVVLGGGTYSDKEIPLHSRLGKDSLARLVEGVRLYRQIPGAKLLLSGGKVFGFGSDAESMHNLALQLGVNPADMVLDVESQDTETQAVIVRQMVGSDPVLLVTSASHMSRATGLFRKAGVQVLPAPAHYLAQSNSTFSPTDIFPSTDGFTEAQRVAYEWMGIVWAKLRGRL